MIDKQISEYLLPRAFNAAVQAGAEIMKVYEGEEGGDYELKQDNTPLTTADSLAHNRIKVALGDTRIPILSEEGREMLYDERKNWELFWLIDPLDGTVEFLKRNNEFTVNIALMSNNCAIIAVVYVPYLRKAYVAQQGLGAYLLEGIDPIIGAEYTYEDITLRSTPLPLVSTSHERFRVAVSRSHQTTETTQYVERARSEYGEIEVIEQGSSYKFCLMAEGAIDYYPRTTHTYEWDTAAAELILKESGGEVNSLPEKKPLRYNKEDLRNPWFECRRVRNS